MVVLSYLQKKNKCMLCRTISIYFKNNILLIIISYWCNENSGEKSILFAVKVQL
jgi:hypothetical protein